MTGSSGDQALHLPGEPVAGGQSESWSAPVRRPTRQSRITIGSSSRRMSSQFQHCPLLPVAPPRLLSVPCAGRLDLMDWTLTTATPLEMSRPTPKNAARSGWNGTCSLKRHGILTKLSWFRHRVMGSAGRNTGFKQGLLVSFEQRPAIAEGCGIGAAGRRTASRGLVANNASESYR